ncbi:MAG TPA: hypothetical protein VJO16_14365 [Candidatus Acidoferrum sp.]|nr:hypothetical protein [Candidatus Acidoferrum sp.]
MLGRLTKIKVSFRTSATLLMVLVRFGLALSLSIKPLLLDAQIAASAENRAKANFLAKVPSFISTAEAELQTQVPVQVRR